MTESRSSSQQAFTLVEMLVSLAIFMVIMTILTGIFTSFLSQTNRMASVMSAYDGARIFSTQLSTELSSTMVRANPERWLNFKVEEQSDDESDSVTLFFTAPDDKLRRISSLNFISHYAYRWDKKQGAVYRAVHNTDSDPSMLAATAADPDNKDRRANQTRLTQMTLAYSFSEPYGWTKSTQINEALKQEPHQALIRNVFDFEVRCFTEPKSKEPTPTTTWDDHTALPLFVEIEMHIADGRAASALRREIKEYGKLSEQSLAKLRRFVITIPMRSHGINDNRFF